MEILLTFLAAVQCAFAEAPKPYLEDYLLNDMDNQSMDDLLLRLPSCTAAGIETTMTGHSRSFSTDFELGYPLRQRSISEGEILKQHKRQVMRLFYHRFCRDKHHMILRCKEISFGSTYILDDQIYVLNG